MPSARATAAHISMDASPNVARRRSISAGILEIAAVSGPLGSITARPSPFFFAVRLDAISLLLPAQMQKIRCIIYRAALAQALACSGACGVAAGATPDSDGAGYPSPRLLL